MKKRSLLITAATMSLAVACSSTQSGTNTHGNPGNGHDIALVDWFSGSWRMETPEGMIFEVWRKQNDSTYAGTSFMVKGRDTLQMETIELIRKDHDLFYIPTVPDQNDGKPVPFRLISTEGGLTFENKAHDFPQRISYIKGSDDSLLAMISGTVNGSNRSESFPMKRVN